MGGVCEEISGFFHIIITVNGGNADSTENQENQQSCRPAKMEELLPDFLPAGFLPSVV